MSSVCPKLSLLCVVQTGSSLGLNTLQSTYVSRNTIVLTITYQPQKSAYLKLFVETGNIMNDEIRNQLSSLCNTFTPSLLIFLHGYVTELFNDCTSCVLRWKDSKLVGNFFFLMDLSSLPSY